MTTGELWVSNPLFPVLVWILAMWVLFSTVVFARNWFRLLKLEKNVAKLKAKFNEASPKPTRRRGKKRNSKPTRGKDARIRAAISEPAATEEIRTNGDYVAIAGSEDSQRTESRDQTTSELAKVRGD